MSFVNFKFFREKCYIDGKWVDADQKKILEVHNPYDQSVIGTVPNCGEGETLRAIVAAKKVLPAWRALPVMERAKKIRRMFEIIVENQEELSKLLTAEMGKTLAEAKGEILYGAGYFEWYAEESKRVYGDVIPANLSNQKYLVVKEPVGVCAALTPWNFPQAMLARKLAPALAAGCTMVAKPDHLTPYSALALGVAAEMAEVPAGVLNIVTGQPEIIAATLMKSEDVKKVSFTGSTRVGKLLVEQSAQTLKKMTMELGGNAPFIVFEDADMEKAVESALHARFRNAGQTCICGNRYLVHESISKEFTAKIVEKVKNLRVGSGLDQNSNIGPLISENQKNKMQELLADAVSHGAQILCGGKVKSGLLFEPTVIDHVQPQMKIYTEEIFGPILQITKFKTEEEAISLANDTVFGLAAYVFTQDLGRTMRVTSQLEYGMVAVNTSAISSIQAPFGGIKHSGFGREGGKYGIEEYLQLKYINITY